MSGIAQLPGFDASLRILIERERYSQTDVGMMFGVSRERIRQLCEARGIEQPETFKVGLRAERVWDDVGHCFRPVPRRELRVTRQRERATALRAGWKAKWCARQDRIITTVAALTSGLGREPSWVEIASALRLRVPMKGGAAISVLNMWGPRRIPVRERLNEFRTRTGTAKRPVGRPKKNPVPSPDRSPSDA